MMDCNWNHPGADRYTGSVESAIISYGFPLPTQSALIAAWEARNVTDTVVIDRDSIRGKAHEYAPEIGFMHFGSRGAVCNTVTRASWTADHVESAIVLCADGECIAIPSVCTNVFRLVRRPARLNQPPMGDLGDGPLAPAEPEWVSWPEPTTYASPEPDSGPTPGWYGSYGLPGVPGAPGGGYSGPCCTVCELGAAPSIPEPGAWALLLAGAGLIAWKMRRKA
jgi:PEP-CTERM motif